MNDQKKSQKENSNDINQLLNTVIKYGPSILQNRPLVKMALSTAEKWMLNDNKKRHQTDLDTPGGVLDDKTALSLAILNSVNRAVSEYKLSPATFRAASEVLGRDLFVEKKSRMEISEKFREEYGFNSPSFLVISPSKACNLKCTGCYADSDENLKSLDWDLVDQIVTDARNLWGTQFIVISGGEPMAYRSQGKTILDLAEKHQDIFFMMYTNGTLITPEIAARMAKTGNIVPQISLEGWRERTDKRRGEGVFDQVMTAMDNLFQAGVLFGFSLTATEENAEEILSEEFIDFLFKEKHALIGWIFQYMPIGRAYTLDLMPTPQKRFWMWNQTWKLIREKKVFLADFWNSGTVVDGCLSAGGHGNGGYLYIEWNGNVTPCVFVPYSPVNVKTIYERGGNLNNIYSEPFFANIRNWQKNRKGESLLNPCLIRDHNVFLREIIDQYHAQPIDQNATSALQDPVYAEGMDRYATAYGQISNKVWDTVYLKNEPLTAEEFAEIAKINSAEKAVLQKE